MPFWMAVPGVTATPVAPWVAVTTPSTFVTVPSGACANAETAANADKASSRFLIVISAPQEVDGRFTIYHATPRREGEFSSVRTCGAREAESVEGHAALDSRGRLVRGRGGKLQAGHGPAIRRHGEVEFHRLPQATRFPQAARAAKHARASGGALHGPGEAFFGAQLGRHVLAVDVVGAWRQEQVLANDGRVEAAAGEVDVQHQATARQRFLFDQHAGAAARRNGEFPVEAVRLDRLVETAVVKQRHEVLVVRDPEPVRIQPLARGLERTHVAMARLVG